MAAPLLCCYNKLGHCKFKGTCRLLHINELCEDSQCEISNCQLRHPIKWKFYTQYQRCKFSEYCSFSHITNSINKELCDKIKNIEKDLTEKNDVESHKYRIVDDKLEIIENKLDRFIDIDKTSKDKDNIINGLKTKIDTIELKNKKC